jgi:hypothetical protein
MAQHPAHAQNHRHPDEPSYRATELPSYRATELPSSAGRGALAAKLDKLTGGVAHDFDNALPVPRGYRSCFDPLDSASYPVESLPLTDQPFIARKASSVAPKMHCRPASPICSAVSKLVSTVRNIAAIATAT